MEKKDDREFIRLARINKFCEKLEQSLVIAHPNVENPLHVPEKLKLDVSLGNVGEKNNEAKKEEHENEAKGQEEIKKQPRKLKKFTIEQRLAYLEMYRGLTDREMAAKLGIDHGTVSRWRRKEAKWRKVSKSGQSHKYRADRSDILKPKALTEEVELELVIYIKDCNKKQIALNKDLVSLKAREIAQAKKLEVPKNFLTWKWYLGFLERHNLTERASSSHIPQILPNEIQKELINFWAHCHAFQEIYKIPYARIGNCDETPIYFGYEAKKTVTEKGAKHVSFKKVEGARKRVTVLLGILANGQKLPPLFIFKGERPISKIVGYGKFYIEVQTNGWCDTVRFYSWLRKCWISSKPNEQNLLILDSAESHLASSNIKYCREKRQTCLCVIPAGFTGIVQPLDVSINKPFKAEVKKKWNEWVASKSTEVAVKKITPTKEQIVKWCMESWEKINAQMIVKSFQVTGITQKLEEGSSLYKRLENKEEYDNEFANEIEKVKQIIAPRDANQQPIDIFFSSRRRNLVRQEEGNPKVKQSKLENFGFNKDATTQILLRNRLKFQLARVNLLLCRLHMSCIQIFVNKMHHMRNFLVLI
eukprot:TRINITY_DN4580_c1_g1_i12.p1 TRINITY_DN4580_c1_g1~~TRINITY_DN4580_c1_g1_i12.p1  ORF type:complete len:589 (+),score=54.91 TRINITY_DN4580_c1_g1_i12:278-2044(+)